VNPALPTPDLGYSVAPPATVNVTVDDATPVENSLTLAVTNRSGSTIELLNPDGLTPASPLPAYTDTTATPLSRIYVWFPWGEASGDLATAGDAKSIEVSPLSKRWAASGRMSDPTLGTYWILFPLSESVLLGQDESVEFEFGRIVSRLPANTTQAQTWLSAELRAAGYETAQPIPVGVWKQQLTASLTPAATTAIPGDRITLSWITTGAAYCSLSPGGFNNLERHGKQDVTMPAESTATFELTAHPAVGRPVTATATVDAKSGWVDLGPFPGWGGYASNAFLLPLPGEFVCLTADSVGNGRAWASPDGRSWTERAAVPLYWGAIPNGWAVTDGNTIWATWDSQQGYALYSSPDAREWTTIAPSTPWPPPYSPAVCAFRGALWVLGGWFNDQSNVVWRSNDGGATWEQMPSAPWQPRSWPGGVAETVFDERLWIGGGYDAHAGTNYGDVWFTADGETWTEAATPPWPASSTLFALTGTDEWLYAGTVDPQSQSMELWQMDRAGVWNPAGVPGPWGAADGGNSPGVAPYGDGVLVVGASARRYVPPLPRAIGPKIAADVSALPALQLAYGVEPPATVSVTADRAHPVENTLKFNVANASGEPIEFRNPESLTPDSELPAYGDATENPLSRLYVWFPWGDADGDLATVGNSMAIVASSGSSEWAASNRMSDPVLGVYWILFPLSKSLFLDKNESVEFDFSGIVSYLPPDKTDALSWIAAEPRLAGFASEKQITDVFKQELSATLSPSRSTAYPGEQIELTWQTTGAAYCSLSPGHFTNLPPDGSQPVTMPAQPSITYELDAYPQAGGRPASAQATVTVESGWIDLGSLPSPPSPPGQTLVSLGPGLALIDATGASWTSADGRGWAKRGAGPPGSFDPATLRVAATNDMAWLFGYDAGWQLYSSTDAVDWHTTLGAPGVWPEAVLVLPFTFRGSLWAFTWFDAGPTWVNEIWSMTGGSPWAQAAAPPWAPAYEPRFAEFAGRLWMCGGARQQPSTEVWSTADGNTWTAAAAAPWGDGQLVLAMAATERRLFATTAPYTARGDVPVALWQMDESHNWSLAPQQPPFEAALLMPTPLATRDGVLVTVAGSEVWRYVPPLDEASPRY
jgi:hypothetical protein